MIRPIILTAFVIMLNLLDIYMTKIGIEADLIYEYNAIAAPLVNSGNWTFLILIKTVPYVLVCMAIILLNNRGYFALSRFLVLIIMINIVYYGFVTYWNYKQYVSALWLETL